jgi:hypothetical protein
MNAEYDFYKLKHYKKTYDRYFWSIQPIRAGEIVYLEDSIMVEWATDYQEGAFILVNAKSECGYGPYDSLKVNFADNVSKATRPSGDSMVDHSSPVLYTTEQLEHANFYKWFVIPGDAGIINNMDHYAIIEWEEDYSGEAMIAVAGGNICGLGEISDTLSLQVGYPSPVKPAIHKQDKVELFPNPTNDWLHIKSKAMMHTINLINSIGQKCETFHINKQQVTIDMATYPDGIYVIEIKWDNYTNYYSIIKQ